MNDHLNIRPERAVVIRRAGPEDADALERLAQLDGRRQVHSGGHLVAEVGREVLAALPLEGGRTLADPFRPTAPLVEMLELRARQLRDGAAPRRRLRAWLSSLRPGRAGGDDGHVIAPATPGNAPLLIPRD